MFRFAIHVFLILGVHSAPQEASAAGTCFLGQQRSGQASGEGQTDELSLTGALVFKSPSEGIFGEKSSSEGSKSNTKSDTGSVDDNDDDDADGAAESLRREMLRAVQAKRTHRQAGARDYNRNARTHANKRMRKALKTEK